MIWHLEKKKKEWFALQLLLTFNLFYNTTWAVQEVHVSTHLYDVF